MLFRKKRELQKQREEEDRQKRILLGDPNSFQNFTEIMQRNIDKAKEDDIKDELKKQGFNVDYDNCITLQDLDRSLSPVKMKLKHFSSISK